ncbi:MAG: nuclear transport factor 2 family protein [Sphingomonadales bacterium]|nr:nuclear transport factor 2 family protein [Sphingomonadales bacterium]MDE2171602.1 nuclear transport factor 2 family protein [Sphingomonadales bacterium]
MTGLPTPPAASADLAIRLARAAFNRALADRDLDAIATVLAREVVLVAGTDSAVITGRKAQVLAWKREFAAAPAAATLYTRTPETILPSPGLPIALEHGQWQGVNRTSGQVEASGAYTAKWRHSGGLWQIEAEIFLTLA